jgi:hypothetical protein
VWSIAETGDGRLWFASFGEGLLRREPDGSLHLVGAVPTGAAARPVPRLISLLADAGEGLWIGTVSGLAYWNGETLEAVAAGELDEAAIIAMDRDPDGSLWLSTRSHGLWRRSPEGRFERSPWNAGIGGARPFGVKADGSGGHWIHTARGLFLADASGLRRLPAPGAARAISSRCWSTARAGCGSAMPTTALPGSRRAGAASPRSRAAASRRCGCRCARPWPSPPCPMAAC